MTQELTDLRNSILEGRYDDALFIVDELESMSKEDKINNIQSYLTRILAHLIKIQIEQRLTNSWRASISESVSRIKRLNIKDNKTCYYIKQNEWQEMLEELIEEAVDLASVEVLGGTLEPDRLSEMINQPQLIQTTQQLLDLTYQYSSKELTPILRQRLAQLTAGE